jgi:hypothetical protein
VQLGDGLQAVHRVVAIHGSHQGFHALHLHPVNFS